MLIMQFLCNAFLVESEKNKIAIDVDKSEIECNIILKLKASTGSTRLIHCAAILNTLSPSLTF